jgi:hypothetical protein
LNDPWAVSTVGEVEELQHQFNEFVSQTNGAAANVYTLQELAKAIHNTGNKENTYSEYTSTFSSFFHSVKFVQLFVG